MWIATKIGFYEFNVSYGNIRVTAQTLEELERFAKIAGEALGREVKVFHDRSGCVSFRDEPRFPTNRKIILDTSELGLVLNLFSYTVDYHDFLGALREGEFLDEAYASAFSHLHYVRWIRESREQAMKRLKETRLRKNKLEYEKKKLEDEISRTYLEGYSLVQQRWKAGGELAKIKTKIASIDGQKTGTPDNGRSVFERVWLTLFGGKNS
ncbi:hypothetical protein EBZ02_09540 [bacterium]|nr:hypothetical protein [bacterium]